MVATWQESDINLIKKEHFIISIAKEQLRQIIRENDLKSSSDVYAPFKDSFKVLLWELLEAELDVSLGYDKTEKHDIEITLYYILI